MNDKRRKLWQQKYHNIIKSKDHIHWLLYTFPSRADFGVISVYFRHIFFHFKINMNVHFRRTWMCSFYSHADSAWVFPPFSRKFLPFFRLATKLRRFSLMAASLALAFPALAAEAQSKSMAKLSWVRLGAAACPRSRIWTNPTPSRRPWPSMELSTYSKLKTESSRDTKNIHHLFRHFQGLINDLGTTWKVKEREATLAYDSWQMSPSVQISCCTFKSTQAHTHTPTHQLTITSITHHLTLTFTAISRNITNIESFGLDGLEDSRDRY